MAVHALDGVVELSFDPAESHVVVVQPLIDGAEPFTQFILKRLKGSGDHGGKVVDRAGEVMDLVCQLIDPDCELINPICQLIDPERELINPVCQLIDLDRELIDPVG